MTRFSITLSDELHKAVQILLKRRHYRGLSEYFQALARYDGQTQRDHHWTAEWAAWSGHERDCLDRAILRQVESGEGVRGSWLEATISEIVKKHLEKNHVPTTKEVAIELAKKIGEGMADEKSKDR